MWELYQAAVNRRQHLFLVGKFHKILRREILWIKFQDTKFAKRGFKKSTQHLISGEYGTENEQYAKNREKENL